MSHPFILSGIASNTRSLARAWLFLGIFALLASGLFSLLLVLSRTPFVQPLIPFKDFFHTAIVVHVDLSVLIWFTAFAATLWSLSLKLITVWDWSAYYIAVFGTVLIVLTPFIGDAHPILNNYIPILQTPIFYVGLSLYGVGLGWHILHTLYQAISALFLVLEKNRLRQHLSFSPEQVLILGSYLAAIAALMAIIAWLYTFWGLERDLAAPAYFEILFWGSGHILQYTHLLLMFVVWLLLLQIAHGVLPLAGYYLIGLFLLSFFPVLYSPILYGLYPLLSAELAQGFTHLMKYGGLSAVPLGLLIAYFAFRHFSSATTYRHLYNALLASMILFLVGGVLGFMIRGANVVIPAHYHGSIVGITLAFMGLSFYLLQHFGYPFSAKLLKLCRLQPILYASGQLMHISGLAWSGGYGVKRKTAGAAQGLERLPEIAGMALMGLGGLIAVIGGVLFLVIFFIAWSDKRAS